MRDLAELIQRIDECNRHLIEARQRLAQLHGIICDQVRSGKIRIEDQIIDRSVWNNYGRVLIGAKMYSDAEQVYSDMLETIRAVEKTKGELHKGLPIYNIGLVQFHQRNFDEGIPNILQAYEQDIRSFGSDDAKHKLASRFKQDLYGLVANELDAGFFVEIRKSLSLHAQSSMDLIQRLTENEFLFLARIVLSNAHVKFRKDMYTTVILYDNLRNLCLLLEVFLKRKTEKDASIGSLLNTAFDQESWLGFYNMHKEETHFEAATVNEAVQKFDGNLKALERSLGGRPEEEFLARVFLTTVLVRHFTSHYFDAHPDLVKDQVLYRRMFQRAISGILYSLDRARS